MTMQFEVRKATRKKARLRLGIAAPSGAGKTLGALLMAYGITNDWDKIGLIDTEEGSGELYVGVSEYGVTIEPFSYIRISKDFSPENYLNAMKALEQSGCDVIIIDSLTHAWAGVGGMLDKQNAIAAKSGNSYTAWRDVTPQHNALVNAILQSPCHVIATMRSKVDYAIVEGDNGKKKVQKLGLAPVQREGMEYEFTTFLDIDSNSVASASKDRTKLFSKVNAAGVVEKINFTITPETGKKLIEWLNTGKANPLVESIKEIFDASILPDDAKGTWIRENINKLDYVDDTKLQGVYEYLTTLKGEKNE